MNRDGVGKGEGREIGVVAWQSCHVAAIKISR